MCLKLVGLWKSLSRPENYIVQENALIDGFVVIIRFTKLMLIVKASFLGGGTIFKMIATV